MSSSRRAARSRRPPAKKPARAVPARVRPKPKPKPKPKALAAKRPVPKPAPAKAPAARPAPPKSRPAPKTAPPKEPELDLAVRLSGGRKHVLSLSFVRDGDEFLARLETDAGHITELKNRSLDQLLTLVAGELEDLLD